MAGDVLLTTARLVLRRFTAATGGGPTNREEIEQEVLPHWLGYYDELLGYGFFAPVERETTEFLGWFHLRPAAGGPPDEPELGYRLRRSAWGQGYATENSRALVDVAFEQYGAHRVFAETMAVNTASRRAMETSGLRLVRACSRTGRTRWRATGSTR